MMSDYAFSQNFIDVAQLVDVYDPLHPIDEQDYQLIGHQIIDIGYIMSSGISTVVTHEPGLVCLYATHNNVLLRNMFVTHRRHPVGISKRMGYRKKIGNPFHPFIRTYPVWFMWCYEELAISHFKMLTLSALLNRLHSQLKPWHLEIKCSQR